jgi:hypothetical protein
MTDLQKPVVHLNGSGRRHLTEAYRTAGDALYTTLDALKTIAPNGRDYYPLGDGALKKAEAEHRARVDAIQRVLDELCELHAHVVEAP